MRYLLDTNIFIYLVIDPDQLSRDVKAILDDYDNTFYISSESHQACLNQRSTAEGKVNGRVVTEVGVANVSCFNRARALLACYQRDARMLNNHNTAKKNGHFLGHSDNLITLSLSLSQALAYKRD